MLFPTRKQLKKTLSVPFSRTIPLSNKDVLVELGNVDIYAHTIPESGSLLSIFNPFREPKDDDIIVYLDIYGKTNFSRYFGIRGFRKYLFEKARDNNLKLMGSEAGCDSELPICGRREIPSCTIGYDQLDFDKFPKSTLHIIQVVSANDRAFRSVAELRTLDNEPVPDFEKAYNDSIIKMGRIF